MTKRPFHDVGSIFPDEVDLCSFEPGTPVIEALRRMSERRFSQVPVLDQGKLRGVFSLWSLAHHLIVSPQVPLADLTVDDVMEDLPAVTVDDSLDAVLEFLRSHDAVVVASPRGIQGIATAVDVLNYFHRIARPFVLMQEIELALREVMTVCLGSELQPCAAKALEARYKQLGRPLPGELREMTFEDYRAIIGAKENWPFFHAVLGQNRMLVVSRLESVRKIRNDLFHFREDVTVLQHQTLASVRAWLLDKTRSLTFGDQVESHD